MASKRFVFYEGVDGKYSKNSIELEEIGHRDELLRFRYNKETYNGYVDLYLLSVRFKFPIPSDTITYTGQHGLSCRVWLLKQEFEEVNPKIRMVIFFDVGDNGIAYEYGTYNVDVRTEIYDDKAILRKYLVNLGIEKEVYLSPCSCYALLGELEQMPLFFAVENGKVVRYEYAYETTHYTNKPRSWIKSKGGKLLRIEKPYFEHGLAYLYIQTSKDKSVSYNFVKQEVW